MRKVSWPKVKFREKLPKLTGKFPSLGFGWELDYYDFLHRWNGGVPQDDWFKVKALNGEDTVARLKYFYGISQENYSSRDLRNVVYSNWDQLPRHSLPIAAVDIVHGDWDLCMLLTFRWGEHYNRVYLLANPHDCGPFDPDDLSELQLVADSLPQFLKLLKPFNHFSYRVWFQLAVNPTELQPVADALLESGARVVEGATAFTNGQSVADALLECGEHGGFYRHSNPAFGIWLAKPNAKIREVACPKKAPKDGCIVAIDAYRWHHPAAQQHVTAALKPLGLDRKLKKLGETPTTKDRWDE